MKTKVCLCCKKELPVSEFWVSRAKKDGLQIYCKKCKSYKDSIAGKKRREKRRKERALAEKIKNSKTNIHWSYPFGGFKITIQNYVKNGEFKYNILPIGGKLFATNSKNEFMDYLEAI